jgi:hypothetical protein
MNTQTTERPSSTSSAADDMVVYKSVSKAAVFSLCFAVLSVGALFPEFWLLLLLPLSGMICGLLALRNIKQYPEELSGKKLAKMGFAVCCTTFVLGLTINLTDYYTEVPDGFERVAFYELQPDSSKPYQLVSDKALQLNGKKVFIKGYPHASVSSSGQVHEFMMVPDMKQCCFGGPPKLIDRIDVSLIGGKSIRWAPRKFELAGVLYVDPRPKPNDGTQGGYFVLEADYVK